MQASARAVNVSMLKIDDSMRRGKIIFFRFIRVAMELWGKRLTADTRMMNMPMVVSAKKN